MMEYIMPSLLVTTFILFFAQLYLYMPIIVGYKLNQLTLTQNFNLHKSLYKKDTLFFFKDFSCLGEREPNRQRQCGAQGGTPS